MKTNVFVALTRKRILKNALEALKSGMKTKTVMNNLNSFGLYLWEYRRNNNVAVWIENSVNEDDAPFSNIVVKPTREGLENLLMDSIAN